MKTLIVFQRLSCWGGDHDDHGDEDQHHAQDENADDLVPICLLWSNHPDPDKQDHHVPTFVMLGDDHEG